MTRTVGKLSPAKVASLLRAGKPGKTADGGDLYLQVTGAGGGSWIFRYTKRGSGVGGKQPKKPELGLGATHTVGLADARDEARKMRQQIRDGLDPKAQRNTVAALTFRDVSELWIASQETGWHSQVHTRQVRNSLRDYAMPLIGEMPVSAIGTADVMRVLDPIWSAKSETASRVRQRIEAILDLAKTREWRSGENPARWRGHLENLLADKEKIAPVKHHPSMDWQQVPAFMQGLSSRQGMAAKALAFLILTASRSAEARGARWGEIDFDAGIWTVPPGRMKAKREHRVPLADPALALLRELQPQEHDPAALVFPGAKDGKPLSDVALAKFLPADVTCHGFRSSFRTWAGETTSYAREVVEMALAHRLGDAVEQAYARGDLFQRRRRLMDAWAAHCMGRGTAASDDDKVVTLHAEAAA